MLKRDNYTLSHIMDIRAQTGSDPAIIERTVFAFGLLEAIAKTGMSFIFKGGTSIMMLLKEPRRLSTDIDILVKPGTDIDEYIQKAGAFFPFKHVVEDFRTAHSTIEKRHFRFYFTSPRNGEDFNVLLDVVFEENVYLKIEEKEIMGNHLLTEGDNLTVRIPNKNCLLGDKLTAFAPHTIGVPFFRGRDSMHLEIIKQMFDCWTILQEMDDFHMVSQNYGIIAEKEIGYRKTALAKRDCLVDTIQTCICILGEGSIREDEYKQYFAGINAIQTHLFNGKMNGQEAGKYACSIMYLAACILTESEFVRIENPDSYRAMKLPMKGIKKISRLKNIDVEAYAQMVRSLQMLQEEGLFLESIDL